VNGLESASLTLGLTPTATTGEYTINSISGIFDGSSAVTGPNGYGGDDLFYDQGLLTNPADSRITAFMTSFSLAALSITLLRAHVLLGNRLPKAWPTRSGFKLICESKRTVSQQMQWYSPSSWL
jgi:hypothetical protein